MSTRESDPATYNRLEGQHTINHPIRIPFAPGKHYLSNYICDLCGYTLTYDNAGPRMVYWSFPCPECKKWRGIKSYMHRSGK